MKKIGVEDGAQQGETLIARADILSALLISGGEKRDNGLFFTALEETRQDEIARRKQDGKQIDNT